MSSYDIAIVGTGGIAGEHAAQVGQLGDRARVVAAVDPDRGRLLGFAERWAVPRLYHSIDTMLACETPDLIDLCTPPGLHAEQAVACLAKGHNVVCEKPPARSLAELDLIAEAEFSGGGRFATISQHRFGSAARRLRRLVGDARLGPPMTAVCHTLWYRPDEYFAAPWRGTWEAEGGGPTLGHGIHQMDLMLSVLGPWRQVVAVADRRARPTATEDLSCALVTFANGAVATVVNSLLSPRETSYLRFDFAYATIEVTHLYGYGDSDWTVTAAPGHEEAVRAAWGQGPHGQASGHGAQLTAILDAIEAGGRPPVCVADTRSTLELITAIYASAFTGRPVRSGEIGSDSPFYRRMDGPGAPWAGADSSPDDSATTASAPASASADILS
jgi:predicted dehydrogenase